MQWIYIICFALISAGLLALFGVRPGDFIDALFRSRRKAATLSDELNVLMGTPAKGFFNQDYELKQILKGTGRADRYEAVKRLSLILFAVGAVLALLINNVYMVPILGIGFSLAPIWYLRSTAASYKKHLNEELETANSIAHRQIGTHLKIPAAYYDKMLEEYPQLLAQNVNAWFQREPSVRMIRTIEGTARAFLSNRYRRIDNLDIASIVLPVLQDMEGMHFESCQLTESRMYIKVVNTRLEAEVVPGDIVQSGIIISNSEVGLGSVNIQPLVYRLVCSNGMVVNDAQTRRNHVGRVNEASENYQLYSEKTLEADDKAFAMKIQDTVRAVVDEVRFTRVVNMMREAKEARMNTTDVPGIVKLVSRDFHITDEESSGVLQRLIEGNDLTLYGLSNAVTRHSQDVPDYDRATALEGIGYNILSMPARQWSRINQLAA